MSALLASLFASLKSEPAPDVVEFLESRIILPPRFSPNEPGNFSTTRRPYMRGPLRCYHPESGVTDLNLCWGAQCVKTTTLALGQAFRVHYSPMPSLWVMPTEALGRSWSQTRWQPLIDSNPLLASHKPADSDEFKLTEMHFDRFTMNVVGSNSPANLASRPAGIVTQDEVCKFAKASSEEASAMKLADQRTKTFGDAALRVKSSTPTTPENEFWIDFEAGDQSYYNVPCPHCGQAIVFEHSRHSLVWDEKAKDSDGKWQLPLVKTSAHYLCPWPECGHPIYDHDKPRMLLGGDWIARNKNAPAGRRSFHLSSFYSPDVTFGKLAVEFLEAQNLFCLQDYYNGWLALPWQEMAVNVKHESILALREQGVRLGRIPWASEDLAFVVLTADPGQNMTHVIATAFRKDGAMVPIWAETVLAIEDLLALPGQLRFETTDGSAHAPYTGLVDSGDFTMRVYDMCARSGGFWWPSKGTDASMGTWTRTQLKTHPLILYSYVDYTLKLALYVEKIQKRLAPLLMLPEDASVELINGLSGQQIHEKRTPRGVLRYFKKLPDDHFGDCLKLALFCWWILRGSVTAEV